MGRSITVDIGAIFEKANEMGCLSFSTLEGETIHARIARFFGYDDEGFYFLTMTAKPFYRQLVRTWKLAVCGIFPSGQVLTKDEHGMPIMLPGFTLRITGDVRQVSIEEAGKKAEAGHAGFAFAMYDISRYPAMRVFCMHRGKGEIFDYDFEMQNRDHKLLRTRFAFGGAHFNPAGCRITEACTGCGACMEACTFKAIAAGSPYKIIGERCDECGSCILACPEGAIDEPETM
jgi:ferredoxin